MWLIVIPLQRWWWISLFANILLLALMLVGIFSFDLPYCYLYIHHEFKTLMLAIQGFSRTKDEKVKKFNNDKLLSPWQSRHPKISKHFMPKWKVDVYTILSRIQNEGQNLLNRQWRVKSTIFLALYNLALIKGVKT